MEHASVHPNSVAGLGGRHMILIANCLVAVVAALHVYFLVLEMFLWTKPLGLKTFRNTIEKATDRRCSPPTRDSITASSPRACSGA